MGNIKTLIMSILYKTKIRISKFFRKNIKENSEIKKSSDNSDFSAFENNVIDKVKDFTMTSPERIVSLIRAVDYIKANNIQGDIVECGVWKGGSIMAILHTLKFNKDNNLRNIFLYDTFEGMTEPTDVDFSFKGNSAKEIFKDKLGNWCLSSLDEVKKNISSVGYPSDNIFYVKGKVEDTIPTVRVPKSIALLRLDTDWYESTLHELEYLFPKLVQGGIIIIDDYGHWSGCKKAVDEYLEKNNISLFLSRVDYTCRIGVKM